MFHIVLSADENYMKSAAVLRTSIFKHTDTSKNFKNKINVFKFFIDPLLKSISDMKSWHYGRLVQRDYLAGLIKNRKTRCWKVK